ncbi:MAG: hypothetical protein AAFW87_07795 [Pseudomonadota bacterium]
MDVVLHIGAHRTASTTFQHYIGENTQTLGLSGLGVWGPRRTRDGLLTGVIPVDEGHTPREQLHRARARIAVNLAKAKAAGVQTLLISDENMIGAPRRNLRKGRLYPDIGDRMARFSAAFDGAISRVAFSIRSHEHYWASVLAFAVARGHKLPTEDCLRDLAATPRMWRDVITDLACALPGAEILVFPYEIFGGIPERSLERMTGLGHPPRRYAREWLNRAPSLNQLRKIVQDRGGDATRLPDGMGRWQPFKTDQVRSMRETYADDLFWLRAGADGLATLTEETGPAKTGQIPRAAQTTRGQDNGIEDRRLA